MQPDNCGPFTLIKVAQDRLADRLSKTLPVVGFRENGLSEGSRRIAPLGRVLDSEDKLRTNALGYATTVLIRTSGSLGVHLAGSAAPDDQIGRIVPQTKRC